jgi:hypothetical protein
MEAMYKVNKIESNHMSSQDTLVIENLAFHYNTGHF